MFKHLILKWENRSRYNTLSEAPDWLLAYYAVSGFLVSGFYGYVLSKTIPEYLEIFNKMPMTQWGWQGWLSSILLALLSLIVWIFGSIFWRCNGLLRERWYK
jgi:H+/Cl- antiporter ClcA